MHYNSPSDRDPTIDKLVRRSDELMNRTKELTSRRLTKTRLAELEQLNNRLLENCDELIDALNHRNN